MRDIKFRAWIKACAKIVEVDKIYFGYYGCSIDSGDYEALDQLEFELMQYTGLKDKNGKEIYEGDIVKVGSYLMKDHPDYNGIKTVVWGGEIFGSEWTHDIIGFTLSPYDNDSIPNLDYNDDLNIEVIGNIYENSELL